MEVNGMAHVEVGLRQRGNKPMLDSENIATLELNVDMDIETAFHCMPVTTYCTCFMGVTRPKILLSAILRII
jgi:hypothetical protein